MMLRFPWLELKPGLISETTHQELEASDQSLNYLPKRQQAIVQMILRRKNRILFKIHVTVCCGEL